MKLLTILVLVFGLVLQTGPLCSTAGQPAAASMTMDCSGMEGDDLPVPESHGKDMAAACHACVSRVAEPSTVPQSRVWKDIVPGMKHQNAIPGIALKPPIPPPRRQDMPSHST